MSTEKNISTESEIRLDKKVTVRSIAPWNTGAARRTTAGDISIPPMGTTLLSREEAIFQGQNGNVLLTGIDGIGSHATWYVEDEYVRNELGFDSENTNQNFLTPEEIKKIFDLKTKKSFEENIIRAVVTRAEKFYLLHMIKKLGFNDYSKVAFCESHCGRRISEI